MVNRTAFAYVIFYVTLFVLLVQGLALALVRTSEPFYSHMLNREFRSWFGSLHKLELDKNDIRKNLAVELMNSQLSIELIFTILHSVTEHTKGSPKSQEW